MLDKKNKMSDIIILVLFILSIVGILASSYNLFEFILRYDYKVKRNIEEHATLFCQLVILHPDECRITGEYAIYQNIEYPVIYAK